MTRLGKYELLEIVGKGGFGTVYRATDLGLNRVVALKVLHPSLMIETEFVDRFRREAQVLARLEHPNIVAVYDIGEAEGRYFIAMRYLPGGSLAERIKKGALTFEKCLNVLEYVCEGLGHAHAQGWVHRDIKPANILFDANGQAVITDFGLARAVLLSSSSDTGGNPVGTPFYRAPELWNGAPPAGPATDVYALGCILGEMLTGQPLFAGNTPDEVITRHLIHGPVFGQPWPPPLAPEGLAALVEKALSREMGARHPDAHSFWQAVEGLRSNPVERPSKTPESPGEPDGSDLMSGSLRIPLNERVKMEFVRIPEGDFLMGSPSAKGGKAYEYGYPQHRIALPEFWMARYPVTVAQFQCFVSATGYRTTAETKGFGWTWDALNGQWKQTKDANWRHPFGAGSKVSQKEDHPVVQVSWWDALAFCEWLSKLSGQRIVLPSEAEWEKAARGVDGRLNPWGNQPPDQNCNFDMLVKDTTPVGRYSPQGDSPYGCADMAGNVWEWTRSLWGRDVNHPQFLYPYNPSDTQREDPGAGADVLRVVRGGSWSSEARHILSALRYRYFPGDRLDNRGFRCAIKRQ